jgi:cytochrome c oxidase subunit IV
MSERAISPITYVVIDLILVVLTILTVALSFAPETGLGHLAGGLAIAIVKAALVVLFFMHALRSRAQTRAVIVVTIFWLAIVMFILTFSDYATRGQIPNLPGH